MFKESLNESLTEEINLRNNKLRTTDRFSSYHKIAVLDLSYNQIDMFVSLPSSIIKLDLSHNKLGKVFEQYSQQMKNIGSKVKSMFNNLINLLEINLSNNSIQSISSTCFETNTNLKVKHLNKKQKRPSVYQEIFQKVKFISRKDQNNSNYISKNQIELFSDLKAISSNESITFLNIDRNPCEKLALNFDDIVKQTSAFLFNVKLVETKYGIITDNHYTNVAYLNKRSKSIYSQSANQSYNDLYIFNDKQSEKDKSITPKIKIQTQSTSNTDVGHSRDHSAKVVQKFQINKSSRNLKKKVFQSQNTSPEKQVIHLKQRSQKKYNEKQPREASPFLSQSKIDDRKYNEKRDASPFLSQSKINDKKNNTLIQIKKEIDLNSRVPTKLTKENKPPLQQNDSAIIKIKGKSKRFETDQRKIKYDQLLESIGKQNDQLISKKRELNSTQQETNKQKQFLFAITDMIRQIYNIEDHSNLFQNYIDKIQDKIQICEDQQSLLMEMQTYLLKFNKQFSPSSIKQNNDKLD